MNYQERIEVMKEILAPHYLPGTLITISLVQPGQLSGLAYEYYPRTELGSGGQFAATLKVTMPGDWLERVHARGLATIKYGHGLLVLQAVAVQPPEGADGAWLVNVVRMGEQHKGRQFGVVGNAVSYGGRLWYHSDTLDKAMEVAANATVKGIGIDEGRPGQFA